MSPRHIVFGVSTLLLATVAVVSERGVDAQQPPQPGDITADPQVELGRLLFWDPVLSGEQDVACATCHHPDFAYGDGRALSLGVGAVGLGPDRVDHSEGRISVVRRNSQTILNTAFNGVDDRRGRGRGRRRGGPRFDGTIASVNQNAAPMFWDNRVRSLEEQVLEPIKTLEEMRGHAYEEDEAVDTVVARLRAIPEYVSLFEQAFGPGSVIDATTLATAIAAFERSLVAMDSPFDRFQAGDRDALTPAQQRGQRAFNSAGCDRCHDGPMFSDFDLHAEGVAEHGALAEADAGDGRFRFRTPTLRNVALTPPYMHNGTLETLDDVLEFYDNGRSLNPNVSGGRGRGGTRLDRDFQRVDNMSPQEMADIVAFLEALSDPNFDREIPIAVPSGLPPGGHLANTVNR